MDCPLLREAIHKRRAFRRRQIIRLVWSGHRDFLRNRGRQRPFQWGVCGLPVQGRLGLGTLFQHCQLWPCWPLSQGPIKPLA